MVVQDQQDLTAQREPYKTKQVTHRKRKLVLWVRPAEGSDRDHRCGRITVTRTKGGQFLSQEQCPEQVEWIEFRPSDRAESYSCDAHVTPRLEDQT